MAETRLTRADWRSLWQQFEAWFEEVCFAHCYAADDTLKPECIDKHPCKHHSWATHKRKIESLVAEVLASKTRKE